MATDLDDQKTVEDALGERQDPGAFGTSLPPAADPDVSGKQNGAGSQPSENKDNFSYANFLSVVKKEGVANQNRFFFNMAPVAALAGKEYGSGNFKTHLLCKSITLPGATIQTAPVRYTGETFEAPFDRQFSAMTITFYVDRTMKVRNFFDSWINAIQNPQTREFGFYKDYVTKELDIYVCDKAGNINYGFQLYDAHPKNIGSLTLDQGNNELMTLDVEFDFHYYITSNPSDRNINVNSEDPGKIFAKASGGSSDPSNPADSDVGQTDNGINPSGGDAGGGSEMGNHSPALEQSGETSEQSSEVLSDTQKEERDKKAEQVAQENMESPEAQENIKRLAPTIETNNYEEIIDAAATEGKATTENRKLDELKLGVPNISIPTVPSVIDGKKINVAPAQPGTSLLSPIVKLVNTAQNNMNAVSNNLSGLISGSGGPLTSATAATLRDARTITNAVGGTLQNIGGLLYGIDQLGAAFGKNILGKKTKDMYSKASNIVGGTQRLISATATVNGALAAFGKKGSGLGGLLSNTANLFGSTASAVNTAKSVKNLFKRRGG